MEHVTGKMIRTPKWDNMKCVLIFCVIMGHISEKYTQDYTVFRDLFFLIYIFHMPAFLFVSGLMSKKTIKEKRYKNVFSYLILYFVIKILRNGVRYLVYGTGSFSLLSESGVAWYAGALFAFCLITILINKADLRWILLCSIILSCFAGYDNDVGDWLILSRIIVYYPFFLVGYMLDKEKLINLSQKTAVNITGAGVLLITAIFVMLNGEACYWLRPLLTGRNPFSELEMLSVYGGVFRLAYYVIVFIIVFSLAVVIPNIKLPLITGIGKQTLSIYAIHFCVIDILWGVFGIGDFLCANTSGILLYLCMFVIAFLIMLVTSAPLFGKLLKYIITPRIRGESA